MLRLSDAGRRIGDAWIWRHLDLSLGPGERLALVGPSGSGKTLLLRAVAALDELDEGRVSLEGRSLEEWSVPEYRTRVMYLPQEAALAEGTVEANVRAPFDFEVHAGKRFRRGRALELLEPLGRGEEFLAKRSEDLSGGERQIAALLRALLLEPRILLLDEPAASMDDALAGGAEALVDAWMRGGSGSATRSGAAGGPAPSPDGGRAVIWTSHRGDRLERVTDRRIEL